jgi:hypothetical protein
MVKVVSAEDSPADAADEEESEESLYDQPDDEDSLLRNLQPEDGESDEEEPPESQSESQSFVSGATDDDEEDYRSARLAASDDRYTLSDRWGSEMSGINSEIHSKSFEINSDILGNLIVVKY